MAININPNRINISAGNTGRAGIDKTSTGRREFPSGEARVIIPAKADVNNIPAPESLQTLIRSAVDSISKGVFWDRGTILNLVV